MFVGGERVPIFEITADGDACWIAAVQNHQYCVCTPPGAANARLIAAAPSMYKLIDKYAKLGDTECVNLLEAINGSS